MRRLLLISLLALASVVPSVAPSQTPTQTLSQSQNQDQTQSPAQPLTRAQALDRAHLAANTLLQAYDPGTGLFRTTGWWNSANAITALVDTARLRNDPASIATVLSNTLTVAPRAIPDAKTPPAPNFLNNFYDDEGWWALAWIDSFDLTGNPRYLAMARIIFHDMSLGWDNTCNGGIWWSKDRNYKNAIANELFLSVAAHLAERSAGPDRVLYTDWAIREWQWFRASGMINADHLVNDGLTIDPGTHTCTNNQKITWTYNQGVLLGGLVSLNRLTLDPAPLATANLVATAATTRLVDSQGILHDPCEPNCGGDGVSFKGIFVRNLVPLFRVTPYLTYAVFLQRNADVLWQADRLPNTPPAEARFSTVWSGPPTADNAAAQASALDLLNAAAAVMPQL